MTTPREGFFALGAAERQILDAEDVSRALKRIAHEIIERNRGAQSLVLVGLHTRGVPLAQRLAALITCFENLSVPVGALDISLHRDDGSIRQLTPGLRPTRIPVELTGHRVVLVDDVICTGCSVRAALDALVEHGRPACIQLAVLIDRGHRELPIRPDYVGKNIPTAHSERVLVRLSEVDAVDSVSVVRLAQEEATHAGV